MSDAEEAMDGSVSGDEAEQSPEKQRVEKPFLWGAGEIIEGKRAKKSVERLDMEVPKKVKLTIGEGSGEKLGEIPRIGFQLNKIKPDALVPLHTLLFDRRGKLLMIKKNIRLFSGFSFDADSEQFSKKRDKLQKNRKSKLLEMCEVLDLEKKGSHSDLVEKIMAFLLSPKSSGKRLPKKKKRSKKNLSGEDGKSKKKPSKKRGSSKQKPSSTSSPKKSKAIVMDSSSDEDQEEEEEEEKAGSEEESQGGSGDESERESGDTKQSESDEESPKPKARGKTKSPAAKKPKAPSKKTAKKRSRKEASDSESESSAEDEEPKKKKSKPAAKTKKADSSSNSKTNNTTADDSSDEDEPLSKMVKKTPSDEQLKETVQSLLKEANLEELTMKQICQKVFDEYSEHDLSSKKDFIKQTVKSLIT